jgi:hypothetical protein
VKSRRYYLYFLLLASLAHIAHASVIASDFDPTNVTYNGGWGIYGTDNSLDPGVFNSMGMAFTPSSNAFLTQIDVAVWWESGTNSVILTLDSDNSGIPGTVIDSWTLNNLPPFGICCTAETATALSPISLTAGDQYWIVVAPGASNTRAGWTNTNTLGRLADQADGPFVPGTSTLSAFEVDGVETPEPSSTLLVAAALALIVLRRLISNTRSGVPRGLPTGSKENQ